MRLRCTLGDDEFGRNLLVAQAVGFNKYVELDGEPLSER